MKNFAYLCRKFSEKTQVTLFFSLSQISQIPQIGLTRTGRERPQPSPHRLKSEGTPMQSGHSVPEAVSPTLRSRPAICLSWTDDDK